MPPIPMPAVPPIKAPEATTGQAGAFNDFLNSVQGHPYQYGTLYDCSGLMSQIYNRMTGKQMPRFNTESDLAAYGFVRGSKPGTFQLGIHHGGGGPNSHMAGTLPDGRSVESSSNGVQIGTPLARGAFDPQFEDHWFLPGSEGMGGATSVLPGVAQAPDDPAGMGAMGAPGGKDGRTQGYIPAGAGGSGAAGSSFFSGALQMGAQAVNGLIDQAASAASSAVSMGANAFAPGAGGAAGGAAGTAIGIGTQAAKRGVQYGFQMAGIGADALTEILMPFGVPRFFQTSPQQFMPQLPNMAAAVTTGEKAQGQQEGLQTPSPSGPVQPGQMPGQQVVGKPAPLATPGTGDLNPAPPPNAPGLSPTPAGPAVPNPTPNPVAPPVPQSGPMAQPQPPAPPIKPTDLGGLLGVYDTGGWLMPGGIAANMTNKPEPILNDDQWGNLHAIAAQGMPTPDPKAVGGSGGDYSMHFGEGSIIVKDVNELQRELDSRQRLQRWRYGGRP
ncbi:NlpC/P60 family protein [Mycobacterium sp.]|uniref:NlpC/P60 family protein n=1 Tax=Mycobacterium sp. TaxID=1785 RepID=UPI0025F5AD51|nr:NlpC/P60 family protein [Mycobacterium sp.]